MSAKGGKHETVERFVCEALEANVLLKLYAAAAAKPLNISEIERYMSNERPAYAYPLGTYLSYGRCTERETWAQDDELARRWAFCVI
jgi:hypothetical protein